MRRFLYFILGLISIFYFSVPVFSQEIGFIEKFSLAEDRERVLKELVPGTHPYFYYHCLHYQNTGKFVKVEDFLKQWEKELGKSSQQEEIKNRQALLTFSKNRKKTLQYLRDKLNLKFEHQKDVLDKKVDLPTELDQKLISIETLKKKALKRYKNLAGFTTTGLINLDPSDLNPNQLRDYLSRISWPDHPNLADLILKDLREKDSRGFGTRAIHGRLFLSQMQELLEKKPELKDNNFFLQNYMIRLRPSEDTNWERSPELKAEYQRKLWDFVKDLSPTQNSLKVHVLYNLLKHDEQRGKYNREFFMEYIKLPRNVWYFPRPLYKVAREKLHLAELSRDFKRYTPFPIVQKEDPVVKRYLEVFFLKGEKLETFLPFFNESFLKKWYAEVMLVNGKGKQEEWASWISPTEFKNLKERIDIDFSPQNPKILGAKDVISLDVILKNTSRLTIKIFKLNALNYYRDKQKEPNIQILLDGLEPNQEETRTFKNSALHRVREKLVFGQLKDPGIYIIELVGNGKSSRALLRKGSLRVHEVPSTAGHLFFLFDDSNKPLKNGKILFGKHEFYADEEGGILIPFSEKPRRKKIIARHGNLISLHSFYHNKDNYSLKAGIFVDREGLIAGAIAKVLVHPRLYLNHYPTTISLLKDARFTIEVKDRKGVATKKTYAGILLHDHREMVQEFRVPPKTKSIKFTLNAEIQPLHREKKISLNVSREFFVNGIEETRVIGVLHLGQDPGGYFLEAGGRNGESLPHRPVHLTLRNPLFRDRIEIRMQTDDKGEIRLGTLQGIITIRATVQANKSQEWKILSDRFSIQETFQFHATDEAVLPLTTEDLASLSLIEMRGGVNFADRSQKLKVDKGLLKIRGLSGGVYRLFLKNKNKIIDLIVTSGKLESGVYLNGDRFVKKMNPVPFHFDITGVKGGSIDLKFSGLTRSSRLHVFAGSFHPDFDPFHFLMDPWQFNKNLTIQPWQTNSFLTGRTLGDELTYILRRKYLRKFPGNMLKRPSLLLNPMDLEKALTGHLGIGGGGGGSFGGGKRRASMRHGGSMARESNVNNHSLPNLNFLAHPSVVLSI